MNNAVGYARPARFANPVVLGTDGIGADMLEEFRLGLRPPPRDDVTGDARRRRGQWLETGWRSCPRPATTGSRGATTRSSRGTLAFTPGVRPLEVVVDGEVVLADGRPTRVDADEVRARAAEQAARLFTEL